MVTPIENRGLSLYSLRFFFPKKVRLGLALMFNPELLGSNVIIVIRLLMDGDTANPGT